MAKSPAPPRETRRHQRFELFASVELRRGGATVVLPARNISLGGLFLAGEGTPFSVGDVVEIALVWAHDDDDSKPALRADAQVVRATKSGLALTWASTDPLVAGKLAALLDRLDHP